MMVGRRPRGGPKIGVQGVVEASLAQHGVALDEPGLATSGTGLERGFGEIQRLVERPARLQQATRHPQGGGMVGTQAKQIPNLRLRRRKVSSRRQHPGALHSVICGESGGNQRERLVPQPGMSERLFRGTAGPSQSALTVALRAALLGLCIALDAIEEGLGIRATSDADRPHRQRPWKQGFAETLPA